MSRPWQLRPLDREAVAGLQEAIAEERADQLEQEAAWNGEEWDDAKHDAVYAAQFKEAALLAGLLAARGFTQPEEALSFLAGEDSLTGLFLRTLKSGQPEGLELAARFGLAALENGEDPCP